ncbi:uncharacterized protein LOC134557452 isoform X2 [Prinia subflava]|uniref:uncharacterized protein LOC134557452 isoform X2 n=1 Tax=Prinia subflava TaxID=208062 RepID=UPI002FE0B05F
MVLAWHWGSASPRSQPRTEVMRRGQHPRATPRRSHPRPPSLLWGTDATGSLFGNRCHQLGGSDSAAATCEPRSGTRCCTNCHMALVAPASLPRPHSAPAPLCSELQRGHGRSLPSGSGPPQGTAGRTALTPEDVTQTRDTEKLLWGQSPRATHWQPAELLQTTRCTLLFWEPLCGGFGFFFFYFFSFLFFFFLSFFFFSFFFLFFFPPRLQEESPAISCSPAMMIPHFQREDPEQCTHPPALLWNCCSHHVGGTSELPAGTPWEFCRKALGIITLCPSLVPFSRGSPSTLIQRLTRQEGNSWQDSGGMRTAPVGWGGAAPVGRGVASLHGAVGRRFWSSAVPWH